MNTKQRSFIILSVLHLSLPLCAMELAVVRENEITGALRTRAQAGQSDAQYQLALLLYRRSPQEAISWYEKSAAAGYVDAFIQLGRIAKKKKSTGKQYSGSKQL